MHFSGAGFPEADFDPTGRVMRGLLTVAGTHRDRRKISSVRNVLSQLDPPVRDQVARGNLMRIL